jgi:hypothetical protein
MVEAFDCGEGALNRFLTIVSDTDQAADGTLAVPTLDPGR